MTTRGFLLSAWTWRPAVLLVCAGIMAIYCVLWSSEFRTRRKVPLKAATSLLAGVIVLALTLVSPLETLADGYLFSAHMLQHLLLLLIIPALLLMAMPQEEASAVKKGNRRADTTEVHLLSHPLLAWFAGVGAMWLWHVPALCDAAATSHGIRVLQTGSLLLLGGMFWRPILGPRVAARLPPLGGVLYLFTACVACTLLGIYLTFAPVSVCSVYLHPADRLNLLPLIRNDWGFTHGVDQQVGGLLMWVPACLIYTCGILGLLTRWYAADSATISQPAGEPKPAA